MAKSDIQAHISETHENNSIIYCTLEGDMIMKHFQNTVTNEVIQEQIGAIDEKINNPGDQSVKNKHEDSVISESNDSDLELEINDTSKENHEIEEFVHAELILTYDDQSKTDKQEEENEKEQNISFHPDKKNHKCKYCEEVFFIYDSLLTHIKRKHSNGINEIIELEHVLNETCNENENNPSVHEVQKRHKCEYCELSFFEYPNLRTHIKRNHAEKFKSFLTKTPPERKRRHTCRCEHLRQNFPP